jgi:hypothetical protein
MIAMLIRPCFVFSYFWPNYFWLGAILAQDEGP